MDREIPTFLLQMHRDGASFRALVRAALARGVPVDDVLGRIEFDDETELFEAAEGLHLVLPFPQEGWLDVLCEELGGDDGAQEVLGRSSGWMAAHTVCGWRSLWAAAAELHAARAAGDARRLDLAVARGREVLTPREVEWTLRSVVSTWPLATLVRVASLPAELVRAELPGRGPWPDLLDAVEEACGAEAAAEWAGRILGPFEWRSDDGDLRYLQAVGEIRGKVGLSMMVPFGRVARRRPAAVWLPEARLSGVPASHALLLVLDAGLTVAEAAMALAGAGWVDTEVLSALRENAIGVSLALLELRNVGWQPWRLAASLREQGFSEPEVREHLRALGLRADGLQKLVGGGDSSAPRPQ